MSDGEMNLQDASLRAVINGEKFRDYEKAMASELLAWRERISKARDMCSPVYTMGDAEVRRTLVAVYELLAGPVAMCPDCNGGGASASGGSCKRCKGSGSLRNNQD